MRARTKGTLLSRLERLESRSEGVRPIKLRIGHVRCLPKEYSGERHLAIAKHLPSQFGHEWVEYEEVPGPDPNPAQESGLPEYIERTKMVTGADAGRKR